MVRGDGVARPMGRGPINLDANANAPALEVVIDAVSAAMRSASNASSGHSAGSTARSILTDARDAVLLLAEGLYDDGVVFTSGCTEANNMALASARASRATILVSCVEHPSILEPASVLESLGAKVHRLPVDHDGRVRLDRLGALMSTLVGPVFLSIQSANGETGVMQPIADIAELIRRRPDTIFHTDAAQSFGKQITQLSAETGPHMASISGHKFHAPMGVGALLLADGVDDIAPLLHGGAQEQGRRAGTEAVPVIAGLAAACRYRAMELDRQVATMRGLRDRLETGLLDGVRGASVNGASAQRLPNTSSIRFAGQDAMGMIARLNDAGVFASQGSACSSMRPTPSHVLLAMGLTEAAAFETVRFSVSPLNTFDEIDEAVSIIVDARSAQKAVL